LIKSIQAILCCLSPFEPQFGVLDYITAIFVAFPDVLAIVLGFDVCLSKC
jgi:hypothetical protein